LQSRLESGDLLLLFSEDAQRGREDYDPGNDENQHDNGKPGGLQGGENGRRRGALFLGLCLFRCHVLSLGTGG
jgi:hypothetical protein